MDLKEHLQLILAAGATIDTLWNIFIGVHFALITAIYFLRRAFVVFEKLVICIAYALFAWFNYWALIASYKMYHTLVLDAQAMNGAAVSSFRATFELLKGFDYSSKPQMVTFIHLIAAAIVLLAIFGSKQLSRLWQDSLEGGRSAAGG